MSVVEILAQEHDIGANVDSHEDKTIIGHE